jgi:hypothetical protein
MNSTTTNNRHANGQFKKGELPKSTESGQQIIQRALMYSQHVVTFGLTQEKRKEMAEHFREVSRQVAALGRRDLAHTLLFKANEIELNVGQGPFKSVV